MAKPDKEERKIIEGKKDKVLYAKGSCIEEVRENVKNYLIEKGYSREEAERKARECRIQLREPRMDIYRPEREVGEEELYVKCSCLGEVRAELKKYLMERYKMTEEEADGWIEAADLGFGEKNEEKNNEGKG